MILFTFFDFIPFDWFGFYFFCTFLFCFVLLQFKLTGANNHLTQNRKITFPPNFKPLKMSYLSVINCFFFFFSFICLSSFSEWFPMSIIEPYRAHYKPCRVVQIFQQKIYHFFSFQLAKVLLCVISANLNRLINNNSYTHAAVCSGLPLLTTKHMMLHHHLFCDSLILYAFCVCVCFWFCLARTLIFCYWNGRVLLGNFLG